MKFKFCLFSILALGFVGCGQMSSVNRVSSEHSSDSTQRPSPSPSPGPSPSPSPNPTPSPGGATLPEGNNGIASQYPGDLNIQSHADVLFFDNFESYTSTNQLWSNYDNVFQVSNTKISADAFAGNKSLEFTSPQTGSEVSNAVVKNISPTQDVLFVRVYTKFDAGYDQTSSSTHNGIRISSQYPGPGNPPNGRDFFLFLVQNEVHYGESEPGNTCLYAYHPEQRQQYGDIWFPDGKVLPYDSTPGNFGSNFVKRSNFVPNRNQWYSYELMVKANTPGQRDGRVVIWIDGNIIADFQNIRMRDVSALKIDQVELELHSQGSTLRANKKYYDNLVVSKSYIGPLKSQ